MANTSDIPRLTMRDIFQSVAGVLNMHHGIFRTILDLAARPNYFFNRYFLVQRSSYTQPITLLLLMLAGVVLSSRHLLPIGDTYSPNFILALTATNAHELAVIQLLREYDDFVRLLLVPITSALGFALFRKQGWFFAEHLAFNAYILAFQFLLMILLVPLSIWGMEWISGIGCLLFFVYTYAQCMKGNRLFTIVRSLVVIVTSNLLFASLVYPLGLIAIV